MGIQSKRDHMPPGCIKIQKLIESGSDEVEDVTNLYRKQDRVIHELKKEMTTVTLCWLITGLFI